MTLNGEYEPSPEKWVRDQVAAYEASGGTEATTLRGVPVVVVTSVGAKSGKLRKNPVMRVEHDGSYALVASKGGSPKHPTWYHNLVAHPTVELQDGPDRRDYTVRVADGERAGRVVGAGGRGLAGLRDYQAKTDREIPVFVGRAGPEGVRSRPSGDQLEGEQRALGPRRARRGCRSDAAAAPSARGSSGAGDTGSPSRRAASSSGTSSGAEPVAVAAGPVDVQPVDHRAPLRAGIAAGAPRHPANTRMVLRTSRTVPSGWAQAPRPSTSPASRPTSSHQRAGRATPASSRSVSAIRGSPLMHGPHWPADLLGEVARRSRAARPGRSAPGGARATTPAPGAAPYGAEARSRQAGGVGQPGTQPPW